MRMLRYLVIVMVSSGMLVVGATAGHSLAPRGSDDSCGVFESIRENVQELESASAFDADGYNAVGKAFKTAAKKAPKQIRGAMKKVAKFYLAVSKAKNQTAATEVYTEQLQKYESDITELGTWLAENCNEASGSSGSSGGSGAGTLTLGDETIALGAGRCYLKEQTAAGQKILWTAQASGTTASGEDVIVDVSRYDASSQFAGDDVSIDIGDPRSSDFVGWSGRYDAGTVDQSGKTVTASGIEVRNDDFEPATASFEISC